MKAMFVAFLLSFALVFSITSSAESHSLGVQAFACPSFSVMDTDANGRIDFSEFQVAVLGGTMSTFQLVDMDQSGDWNVSPEYGLWVAAGCPA